MRNIILAVTLSFLPVSVFALQGPYAHFDTDKSEVINANEISLFAETVAEAATDVTIYCHTDSRASKEYNEGLAGRRCDSVEKLLEGRDLKIHKINVVGEDRLLVDENGEVCSREALNRRVEIFYELAPEKVTDWLRHRLEVLVGYAPSGLTKTQINARTWDVSQDYDVELGLAYSYNVTRRWTIGVQIQTNKSAFGKIGFEF